MKLVLAIACAIALACAALFLGCAGNATDASSQGDSGGVFAEAANDIALGESGASGEAAKTKPASDAVERKIASMTLEQKVAQLFIVTPGALGESEDADPMTECPVGGFLYFGNDVEDPDQVRDMLAQAQRRSQDAIGLPAFLCVDEEGGTVARVAGNPDMGVSDVGNMQEIGWSGDVAAAGDAAVYIGSYLSDLGFNVDFAPVADLADGDDSMALRSFGADVTLTSDMVKAQVEGFLQTGVLCAPKHFPGIGGIEEDSHDTSIYSRLSLDEFRSGPLRPFAAGIAAGAPFVMVGHLSTPEATGDDTPASLSRAWLTDVLRGEMGFEGVIVTDSLGMAAVYERYSQYELGALCLEAGADMLLKPADFLEMRQGVLDAVARGELSEERIDESLARVLRAKGL